MVEINGEEKELAGSFFMQIILLLLQNIKPGIFLAVDQKVCFNHASTCIPLFSPKPE